MTGTFGKEVEFMEKNCVDCKKPISEEDLTILWENEDEGITGEMHLECMFKKDMVICRTKDCGYLCERNDMDMTEECPDCGGKTGELTKKDKAKLIETTKITKEMRSKKE